jgi:hypothetical protein
LWTSNPKARAANGAARRLLYRGFAMISKNCIMISKACHHLIAVLSPRAILPFCRALIPSESGYRIGLRAVKGRMRGESQRDRRLHGREPHFREAGDE